MMFEVDAHKPAGHVLRGPLGNAPVLKQMLFVKVSLFQNLNTRNRKKKKNRLSKSINSEAAEPSQGTSHPSQRTFTHASNTLVSVVFTQGDPCSSSKWAQLSWLPLHNGWSFRSCTRVPGSFATPTVTTLGVRCREQESMRDSRVSGAESTLTRMHTNTIQGIIIIIIIMACLHPAAVSPRHRSYPDS